MLKIEVIGNLGATAEVKSYNGEKFVTFRVASTNKFTNKQTGEITEDTTWISCIWRGEHPRVTPLLTQGTKVFVRGDAALKIFVGHDGNKHAGLNLRVQELELCGSKPQANPDIACGSKPQANPDIASGSKPQANPDIPF